MKEMITISVLLPFLLIGCGEGNWQSSDEFITVDVTASYPKKELILQDFLDVEYVPLETSDEFLTSASMQAIGKNLIILKNARGQDGDIFIFDRAGKGLRKINRSGRGSQEYLNIGSITLDEENDELFINNYYSSQLIVYDLSGNFKRTLKYDKDLNFNNGKVYNFDQDNLICYDETGNYRNLIKNAFLLISKQDGSVTREAQIPYEEKVSPFVSEGMRAAGPRNSELIPYNGSWIFVDTSSDTIYSCSQDYAIRPFIIKTPSLRLMDTKVFLFPGILTDRYWFIQTIRKEWDFDANTGFPRTNLAYDKHEKEIFECVVYNSDFIDKTPVDLWYEHQVLKIVNNDGIAFLRKLEANDLVEAYENGKLKGRLKEIAAGLDEESNPVIMIAKYKE